MNEKNKKYIYIFLPVVSVCFFVIFLQIFRDIGVKSNTGVFDDSVLATSVLGDFSTTNTLVSGDDIAEDIPQRIRIPSIGVDMPIIANESNGAKALRAGAWLIPGTAQPDNHNGYNNTVISAHRYLYTSGPYTFYFLDQLKQGDEIEIIWDGMIYRYQVTGTEVVEPDAVHILGQTEEKMLSLFTCTPLFTTKQRLVVYAIPVE